MASAAELADDYAPELNFKVAMVGAAPADLTVFPLALDGTLFFIFEAYTFTGIGHTYGVDIKSALNDKGKSLTDRVVNRCTQGFMEFAGNKLSELTADGSTVQQFIGREPYKTMLVEQQVGLDAPSMPVYVTHSRGDDIVPFSLGKKLAKEWKSRGADVTFVPMRAGIHATGAFAHINVAIQQFEKVFGR